MGRQFSKEDLETPSGRRAIHRALLWGDHGILRYFYDNSHILSGNTADAPQDQTAPQMWRSYQPSPEKISKWHQRGIRTIINLRGETPSGHYLLEKEACEKLGITLIDFRVYSREAPTLKIIKDAKALFQSIEYPAMMHCKSGADRAGVMSVLYKFFHEGQPLDEALKQLSFRYGHIKQGKTGIIDYAFEKYIQYANTHQIALTDQEAFLAWASEDYDPVALKKEFLSSWWGRLLSDKILRRE